MAIIATELGGGRDSKKELQTKGLYEIEEFNRRQLERINKAFTPQTEPAWPGSPQLVPKGEGLSSAPAVYETKAQPQGTAEALGLGSARAATPAIAPAAVEASASEIAQTERAAYTPATFTSYEPNYEGIKRTYDAAREAALANLEGSFSGSLAEYEAARGRIAPTYETQRNAAAGEADRQRQAFNEYAAARGLGSGASAQAEIARGNALAQNLGALNAAQANAEAELEADIARLKAQYQSAVREAIAENDYERASALMSEYRTAEESRVKIAEAQADEDYRAFTAQYQRERDEIEDARYLDELQYKRRMDALKQASSGSSGGGTDYDGFVNNLLTLGDSEAMETLLSSGLSSNDRSRVWKLYQAAKKSAAAAEPAAAVSAGAPSVGGTGMNESLFGAITSAALASIRNGKEENGLSAIEKMWPQLSDMQKVRVRSALAQAGYKYEE